MKKILFWSVIALMALAGSTFASGDVTSGSTATGNVNTGTVLTGTITTGTVNTGTVTTGGTNTGSTNTGTVSTGTNNTGAICMQNFAATKNAALQAIAEAFKTDVKNAIAKRSAAIDAARASGKSKDEIKAMVKNAREIFRADMKAALKKAQSARKAASKTFEQLKDSCKTRDWKKWYDYRKNSSDKWESNKNRLSDDDKNDDDNDDYKGRDRGENSTQWRRSKWEHIKSATISK